ncbi:MAG TPA: hypothetical protein VIA82_10635 [Candidatus Limnocylindria bacterium]|jgi:hypothetical protein
MLGDMLQNIWSLPRSGRSTRGSDDRVDVEAARLNPWLRWRPDAPVRAPVLSVAELAECTCPDLCDRDHANE